jgi:lipopolysaccharide export system permease protein
MVMTLFDGEVHQSFSTKNNLYRIIEFDDAEIRIDVDDFAFKRTDEGLLSRGDREMHISDMEKIVSEIDTNIRIRYKEIKSTVKNHLNYLLFGSSTNQRYNSYQYKNADSVTKAYLDVLKNVELQLDYFRNNASAGYNILHTVEKRKNTYIVEIQKKYAIPFACFVFVLIGAPLGIVIRRGNFGISALLSLGFYIFYWMFLIGGEKLADRDLVSPYVGMWLANIIIGAFGILLTIRVNRESFKYPILHFLRKIKIIK